MTNNIVGERAKQKSNQLPGAPLESGEGLARLAENPLSEREMEVANLLVTGATNNEIAEQLVISPHTVKVHLRNIYDKLAVSSRTEASMLLLQQGWMTLPGVEVSATGDEAWSPPDPLPLSNTLAPAFAWQPFYLAAATLLVLALLLVPALLRAGTPVLSNLLTDRGAAMVGQPLITVDSRWRLQTPLPAARSRLALVASSSGDLYAIGGEGANAILSAAVDVYDLNTNEWRSAAALPVPLANMDAVAWQGSIFVAGGTTAASPDDAGRVISDVLWRYDLAGDSWEAVGKLPMGLAGAALVTEGDRLYLIGGWDGEQARSELWALDLPPGDGVSAADWQTVSEMGVPRAFSGAVVVDGKLYIAGGYDGQQELNEAQRYTLADNVWEELPPLTTPRSGLHLLYDGLAIFAVGGGWTQAANTLERFDPNTLLWSHFSSPIADEWRHLGAAASVNGYLYLVGGWSQSYLNTHLHYQSSFRTFLPSTRNTDSKNNNPP